VVFEVTILGSNSASFAYNRHHTSQIININQQMFMVDCGEGTQLQLARYKIKTNKLSHIFISHLHGDHYFGLMGLISTMHLHGRTADLWLYGPRGLAEIITLQLKHSDTRLNYKIHFQEIDTEVAAVIAETDLVTIESLPLEHRIRCSGFIFKEKPKKRKIVKEKLPPNMTLLKIGTLKRGEDVYDDEGNLIIKYEDVTLPPKKSRTYAYCSDTRYNEKIIPYIQGVDMLYHESTFLDDMESRAVETYHSTARQAATIALKANVGKLVLGHFSSRYKEIIPLLEEAKTVFAQSYLSIEGETFYISED
jgi:ribonuclease Z